MKNLLIASLILTGLTAFAPTASAKKKHDREFAGYDRCGHPVYREVYRPKYKHYEERPVYYREAAPVRYYDDRPRCRETHRRVSPLSFIFGF